MLSLPDELESRRHLQEGLRRELDLPAVRAAVGRGSIDMLNFEQGWLLMHGLNLRPRPVIQGYSAYTPTLMRINQRFILSEKAPDFLLVRHSTIDDRFAGQDDALLLCELPRLYEPVLEEKGMMLLRRSAPARRNEPLQRVLIGTLEASMGVEVQIPEMKGQALWIQVSVEPTMIGQARALLHKPAPIDLVLTDDRGMRSRHRLVVKAAEEGFLVRPLLGDQRDFVAFMQGRAGRTLKSLRIEAGEHALDFWRTPRFSLYAVPGLKVAP